MADTQKLGCQKTKRSTYLKEFLEEVNTYKFLYDRREKDFRDAAMKQAVWTAIGMKFDMTAPEAEKKYKVQRDRYNKEKKKYKESLSGRNEDGGVYVSNWYLYKLMDSMLGGSANFNERYLFLVGNLKKIPLYSSMTNIGLNEITDDGLDILSVKEEPEEENPNRHLEVPFNDGAHEDSSQDSSEDLFSSSAKSVSPLPEATQQQHRAKNSTKKSQEPLSLVSPKPSSGSNRLSEFRTDTDHHVEQFCRFLNMRLQNLDKRDRFEVMRATELLLLEKEGQDKYFNEA